MQIAPTPPVLLQWPTSDVPIPTDVSIDFMQVLQEVTANEPIESEDGELDVAVEVEDETEDVVLNEHVIPQGVIDPSATNLLDEGLASIPVVKTNESFLGAVPSSVSSDGTPEVAQNIKPSLLPDVKIAHAPGPVGDDFKQAENPQILAGKVDRGEVLKDQFDLTKITETSQSAQKTEPTIRQNASQLSRINLDSRLNDVVVSANANIAAKQPLELGSAELKSGILGVPSTLRTHDKAADSPVAAGKRPMPEGMSSATGIVLQQLKQTIVQPLAAPETQPKPDLTSQDLLPARVSTENAAQPIDSFRVKSPHQGFHGVTIPFPIEGGISNGPIEPETAALSAVSDMRAASSSLAASVAGQQQTPQNLTPATAHQVAVAVHKTQDGVTELVLNPEELGRVRLAISTQDGVMAVTITTERPETQDLMRRHIDMLAQEMKTLGYNGVGFTFEGQGGDQQSGQGTDRQSHEQDTQLPDAQTPLAVAVGGLDLRL